MNDMVKTLNKTLSVWKKECSKHESCEDCPFSECLFLIPPDSWKEKEMDRSIDTLYNLGWKGGADE